MSWADVGKHVQRARALRRQTQAQFAHEIVLSVRVVGALESGQPRHYDPVTIHRIESALGWAPGSVERVVEGGRPVVEVDPQFARIRDAWPRLSAEARSMLANFAASALRRDM